MKKLVFWCSLLLCGSWLLGAAEAEVMNLDFAQKSADNKIMYWKQRGGAAEVTVENGVLKIAPQSPSGVKFLIQQPLLLKAGATYAVEYEVRGGDNMKASVYVEYRNQDRRVAGHNAGLYAVSKDWKKTTFKFTMPEKFSGPYMVIMISAGSQPCEFRNLSFKCVGQTDFAALKRSSAALTCFPMPQQTSSWRRIGAASGKAEYADNVLKLTSGSEKGMAFFIKGLNLKPGVKYTLSAVVKQPSGQYGIYVEYTAANGRRGSINGRFMPATGATAKEEKLSFSLPEGAKNIVLILAAGKSNDFAEFSNLKLTEAAEPTNPTVASSWRGGKVVIERGKPVLMITDTVAKAKAELRQGQYYRFSFDAATRSSKELTGFANFKFAAAAKDNFFFETDWDDIIGGNGSSKELVFCSPVTGIVEFNMNVRGIIAVFALRLEEVAPQEASPADVVLTSPAYRRTMYTSQRKNISGKLSLQKDAASAKLTLLDSNKKPCSATVSSNGGTFTLPDTAQLPVGKYTLQVEVFDKSNKALPSTKVEVKVADVPETFYQFDPPTNTFYRNGKPVSLHGFMANYEPELAYFYSRNGVTTFTTVAGTPEQLLEALDHAHAYNFKIILFLRVDTFYRENKDFIDEWKRYINYLLTPEVLAHPALAAYCSADEPAWCSFPIDKLAYVTEYMHKLDPSRPVWINEAPRGSVEVNRRIARLSDAFGVDIYPIPAPNEHSGLPDKMITSVGAYTRRCREAAGDLHPIWMVLQGFSWNGINNRPNPIYPNKEETRFMALEAMANKSNALLYWGVANIKDKVFFMNMINTIHEVSKLNKLWQSGNTLKVPAAPGMKIFAGTVNGARYIVALNTTPDKLDSKIDLNGLYELPSGKKAVSAIFDGYTARVFASVPEYPGDFTERVPYNAAEEAKAMHFINRKFAARVPYQGKANWIWYPGDAKTSVCKSTLYFDFDLKGKVKSAQIMAAADDVGMLKLNGKNLGKISSWRLMETFDITNMLKARGNRIAADVASQGAPPSGFIAELEIVYDDNTREVITTGTNFKAIKPNSEPRNAEIIAPYGGGAWGKKLEYRKESK